MKLGKLEIPEHAETIATGVSAWTNPHNRYRVVAVHYSADPAKRTSSWRQEASRGYRQSAWDQEFEIDFTSWAGRPVFSGFNRHIHVSTEPLDFTPSRYIYRAWDIGTHAVIWAQRCDQRLYVYAARQVVGAFSGNDELKYRHFEVDCSGLGIFISHVEELSQRMFKDAEFRDVVDPFSFAKTSTHEYRPADVFMDYGIDPIPGETQDVTARVSAVEDWLGVMVKGQPAIIVDSRAKLLVDALAGGYHWSERISTTNKRKIDKNGFSHIGDALTYLCTMPEMRAPSRGQGVIEEEKLTGHLEPAQHDFGRTDKFEKAQNRRSYSGMFEEREHGWTGY
jgi:hypothetical protein